jgi:hypothetical protein
MVAHQSGHQGQCPTYINRNIVINWLLIMLMGWDVSEPRPPVGLLFIPWVICKHGEPWWWWCWLGKTPYSSRDLWQSYQQRHMGVSMRNERRSGHSAYQYLRYINGSLICHKILQHGASSFTSHTKEGVLWVFIALKNSSHQLGLNPQPLESSGKHTNHYTTEAT